MLRTECEGEKKKESEGKVLKNRRRLIQKWYFLAKKRDLNSGEGFTIDDEVYCEKQMMSREAKVIPLQLRARERAGMERKCLLIKFTRYVLPASHIIISIFKAWRTCYKDL